MIGAIARCSQGYLGVITDRKVITYNIETTDQDTRKGWRKFSPEEALAWTGFHLSHDKMGELWSSRKPTIIAEAGAWGIYSTYVFKSILFPSERVGP